MVYRPTELLTVYLDARNQHEKVGRLAVKDRRILFEYDAAFIASGIEISPVKLPLKPGVFIVDTTIFDGLFGVFNDSLPDGWGRLLLDRTVERYGILRGLLNPLDRLAYVGRHGEDGHMDYATYRRRGLPMGSGAIESAIRRVINLRLKGNSVFWEEANAEGMLQIRGLAPGSTHLIFTKFSAEEDFFQGSFIPTGLFPPRIDASF